MYIHRVHANKSLLKIWENRERGRIQGLPNFFEVPAIISGMGKATNVKFGRYRVNPNKSPLKFSGENGPWGIQGLPKLFECPLLSQERVKVRTSNLAGIFTGPCEQKPFKNLGE